MRKWIAIAIVAASWCPQVKAQGCYPGNTPTVAVSTIQAIDPSAAPFATTINYNGNHSLSIGPGTSLTLNVTTHGLAAFPAMSEAEDNGPYQPWFTLGFMNGQTTITYGPQTPVGHVFHDKIAGIDASGNTTQDVINVTIVNQPPGVYASDSIGTNAYYSVTTTYSGTPNILFSDCPHMQNAHHTPKATLQLQSTSGEVHQTVSATGTTVPANSNVYAVVSDYISANVGDTITASYGGSMWCDLVQAWVWQSLVSFRIEYAQVVAKDLGHAPTPGLDGSSIYDVATICDNDSDPADWQPTVVHSFSGRHPYWWGFTSLFRAPDLSGVPWIPLASYMTDLIPPPPEGGPLTLAKFMVEGGAVPYPANVGPDFPVPGKCTQYPKNVILTLSSKNVPWWPFNN